MYSKIKNDNLSLNNKFINLLWHVIVNSKQNVKYELKTVVFPEKGLQIIVNKFHIITVVFGVFRTK